MTLTRVESAVTVAELIEKLKEMPQDLAVHKSWVTCSNEYMGPESHDDEVYQVDIMRVAYDFKQSKGWKYKDVVVID